MSTAVLVSPAELDAMMKTEKVVLIDTRDADTYAAGHIPGAVNIPTVAHIAPDGTLKSPEAIRYTVEAAGVDVEREITLY